MNETTMASTPIPDTEPPSVARPGRLGDLPVALARAIDQFDEATDHGRSTIAGNELDEAALELREAAMALLTNLVAAQPTNTTVVDNAVVDTTVVDELPVVRVVASRYGPTLVCPVCDARSRIVEVDEAIRFQELYVEDRRIRASSAHNEAHWNHARFECLTCETPVRLPVPPAR